MGTSPGFLLDINFAGPVIHWRGPSPYHFVAIPAEQTGEIRYAARLASYGWGVVPVEATLRDVDFRTSLFPKDGDYLLPLKAAVRNRASVDLGQTVGIRLRIAAEPPAD